MSPPIRTYPVHPRWFLGLILLAGFFYYNFIVNDGPLLFKLIQVGLVCSLFVLYRVIVGPSAADRIVAVDILGILIIGMLALIGLHYKTHFFMDVTKIRHRLPDWRPAPGRLCSGKGNESLRRRRL